MQTKKFFLIFNILSLSILANFEPYAGEPLQVTLTTVQPINETIQKKERYCLDVLGYSPTFKANLDKIDPRALYALLMKEGSALLTRVNFIAKTSPGMTDSQKEAFKKFNPRYMVGDIYTGTTTYCGILHLSSLEMVSVHVGVPIGPVD